MDGLGPIDIQILIDNPALLRSLIQGERDTRNTVDKVSGIAKQSGAELDNWAKKAALAATSYFSVTAAKNFVAELVNVRGQFEQLNVAYQTILKSKSKGDMLFAETVKFAATTPFNLTDVAQATKQLLAYGFAAKDITDVLTTTGNIAAGVSAPLGDIVYLYGTLKTQGRAYAQDIRQFTGRGIPIIAELAKQFGVAEDQVNNLVEAGKVGFPEVERAFKNLTGSTGIFYNLMEKQSHTLTGQLSNLQDAYGQMLNALGEANEGILVGGIQAAANLIKNYQKVLDIMEVLIITYGAYRAAVLLQTAASLANTAAIGLETIAYRILRDGLAVLNAERLVAVATTAGYTAVIAGVVLAIKSWHDASELQNKINNETTDITADANVQLSTQKAKVSELTKIINDHNATQEQRLGALKKLNEISPEYLGNITLETAGTKAASQAIKDYLADLEDKLVGEAAYSQKLENLKKVAELKTKGIDAISSFDRVGLSMKGIFKHGLTASSDSDNQTIVNDLIKSYEAANNKIDEVFGNKIKNSLTGGDGAAKAMASKFRKDLAAAMKADGVGAIIKGFDNILKEASNASDLESLKKGLEEKIRTLAPNDKQIDQLTQRINRVNAMLAKYDPKTGIKGAKEYDTEMQRYAAMIDKIAQLNQKYRTEALSSDEQKLQDIRNDFNKLRAEIDRYNGNPKNTRKINKGVLQGNENAAIYNQVDLNTNDAIKADLDNKKAMYAEYEAYKEKLGVDAANKEYAVLLQSGENYADYLQQQADEITTGPISGALQVRKLLIANAIVDEKKEERQKNLELLEATRTYEQQRAIVIEKYRKQVADLIAQGNTEQAAVAAEQGREELTALDEANIQKLQAYKELFNGIAILSDAQAKEDIAALKRFIDAAIKAGTITKETYDKINKQLKQLSTARDNKSADELNNIANAFADIANELTGVNEGLATMLGGLGGIAASIGNVQKLANAFKDAKASGEGEFEAGANLISAGISSAISLVGIFTSAAKERKAAEEAYQASVLQFQNDYNLSLNEEIRLRTALNANVFTKDYKSTLLDGAKALSDANDKYLKSLDDLNGGKAKIGQGNAVNAANVGKGAVAGATLGAAVGSVVPVIGTVVGGIVGGIGGAIAGLFGGKKKKDIFGGLLDVYPGLIKTATDGTKEFDSALAKSLVANNQVDEKTKALLNNTIALADARKAALEQITGVISDLAGSLGDDLRNSLVNAFKDGSDAAQAFGDDVSKVLENIISQFAFNEIFGKQFDSLQQEMEASFNIGGDQSFTDDIVKFYKEAGPLIDQYNQALQAAQDEGKKAGLDLFTNNNNGSSPSSVTGAIKAITAEQAGVLEGTFRGVQQAVVQANAINTANGQTQADSLKEMRQQTLLQMQIAANTKRTADNTDQMRDSLKSIDNNTSANNLTSVLQAAGI